MKFDRGKWLGVLAVGCAAWATTVSAAEVCPPHANAPLHSVDVFDGTPEELADLMADVAGKASGYFTLGYIYDAGRFVTVRCKYADGYTADVRLPGKVDRCDYAYGKQKTLSLICH